MLQANRAWHAQDAGLLAAKRHTRPAKNILVCMIKIMWQTQLTIGLLAVQAIHVSNVPANMLTIGLLAVHAIESFNAPLH